MTLLRAPSDWPARDVEPFYRHCAGAVAQAFQQETLKTRLRLLDLMKNIEGLPGTLLKIFALSLVIESVNLLLPVGTQLRPTMSFRRMTTAC